MDVLLIKWPKQTETAFWVFCVWDTGDPVQGLACAMQVLYTALHASSSQPFLQASLHFKCPQNHISHHFKRKRLRFWDSTTWSQDGSRLCWFQTHTQSHSTVVQLCLERIIYTFTQRTAVTMHIWLVVDLWTKINKASPVRNLTSIRDIENKGLHLRFSHFPTEVGQKRGIHLECGIGANNSLQCRRPWVNIYKMEGAQVGQKEGHGNSAPARTMDIDLSKQRTAEGGKTIHLALVMLLYDYFSRGQFPIHFNKEKKDETKINVTFCKFILSFGRNK